MNEMRIESANLSENIEADDSLDCYQDQISEDLGRFQLPIKTKNDGEIPTFTKNKKGEIDSADFENQEIVPSDIIKRIDRKDCQFCQWKIHRIDFLRRNMHLRYFDAFNFYFAKPINEILANYQLPHVIALKDYQYFDESNEYLKRYYSPSEVPPRMGVLTNFFSESYKPTRPNLMATSLYKVMQKHDYKKTKLFLKALSRKNGIDPHRQMPRFYNRNDDDTSETSISSSQTEVESQQNNNNNPGQQSNGNQFKKRKNKLPSRIIYSNLSRSITMSCQNSTYQDNNNLQQLGTEYENYRNFILQISFESCEPHDVYNPQFSRSINSSMNRQQSQENLFADSKITSRSMNQKITQNNSSANNNNTLSKLDEPRLMELLMVNNKINSCNFDNLVEQMSLHDQKQLCSDLFDEMVAEKNNLTNNSQDEEFNIDAYILGDFDECAKKKDPNGLFSSPSTSLLNNVQKTNTESRLMCSLSEFNNPNTQNGSIDKSSATTPYNNRSSNFLTSSKGNSNNNNNNSNQYRNNTNKSGGNAYINNIGMINQQNLEGAFDGKVEYPKSSSQFNISNIQPNLCRSNSDSKQKTSKSIQQVQQYILSQIKKQHDPLNTNGSIVPNIQLHLQDQQQTNRQQSVSPTLSPTNAKNLQNNTKKVYSRQQSQQSNGSKRKLTDRNNTETNLGSVFEKLRQSMRMGSQEGIQTQSVAHTEPNQVAQPKVFLNNFININQFNPDNKNNLGIKTSQSKVNLEEFTQRLSTGEQIPVARRRGESGNAKGINDQNQVGLLNKNNSPSASITPREISKKPSVNHFVIATESTPHQNSDQSPLLGGSASIWTTSKSTNNLSSTNHQGKKTNNFQTIEKKTSQISSNKRLVIHPKAGKNSSQDCSISPTHFPHKFNSMAHSAAMFQGQNKSQGELPGTISTEDISPIGNGHNNLLSFSQKILTLNQKLGQQNSKEEHSGKGLLWPSELRNSMNSLGAPYFDKERKSGRIRTSNSPPPALSKFKKTSSKVSQDRIGSPGISGAQTARNERNTIPNSYFQHSNSLLNQKQQQQQSIGSNGSSVHLLQSGVSHILQTDNSQQSLMLNTTGSQQQQPKQQLNSGNQKIDKQMTERILTNALTNTINKFYKNMTKSSDASEAQSLRASCKLNPSQPQQPLQSLQLQEVRHIQSEADLSPLLKQGAKRQIQLRQSSDIIPGSRGAHSQKESIGSTASSAAAFQIGLVDQIQGKNKGAVPNQQGLISQIYSSTGQAQMIYANNHPQQQQQIVKKGKQPLAQNYQQQGEIQMSKGFSINNNNNNNGNLHNNLNFNKNNNNSDNGGSNSSLFGGIVNNQSLNSQGFKNNNNNNWQSRHTKNNSESEYNNIYQNHLNMQTISEGNNNNNTHNKDYTVGSNSMQEEMEDITDTGVVQNNNSINININNNYNAASITNNHNNYGFPSTAVQSNVGIFKEPNIRFYEQTQNINSYSNQVHQKTSSEFSYQEMMNQNMQKQPSVKNINNIIASQQSKILSKNTNGQHQPHHTRGESQKLITSPQQTKPQSKATSQHQYIQIKGSEQQQQLQQFQQQLGFHPHSSSHRIVKTEANEDTPRLRQSTQQEMLQSSARNFPGNSKPKNENNQLTSDNFQLLSNRNSHTHIHSQPNNQLNFNYAEILPQDSDFKILHGASKMKAAGTHFSPIKGTEEKINTKMMQVNEEAHHIWQVNHQNNFQVQNPQSLLLQEKKTKEDIQHGSGFYTQRNPPTKTRKQSDDIKPYQQTKTIQSSRGSYQGQYGDISTWKQVNWNQLSQPDLQQKASNSPLKKQPQQQVVPQHQVHQLHSSQSQTNLISYQQPSNGVKKGNLIGGISQQQAAGLLNSKIKQLSQKI